MAAETDTVLEKFFGTHLTGVRPEGDIVPESCRR